MNQLQVPSKIKLLIDQKPFTVDDIGMSGNQVLLFEDMVLKIEGHPSSLAEQVQVMQWLSGKLPVPQVLAYEEEDGKGYLLMSRIEGEMSCDTYYLENHRPSFEPVFSHGDYCLPNVFLKDGQVKGFIDLDRAGIGDKWNDIALCYRSLKHNFDGTYGEKVYEDFNLDMLFDALGIEPDWEKIKYYLLLDELF